MKARKFISALCVAAPMCVAAQATFEVGGIVYTEDLSDPSKLAVIVVAKKSPMIMEGMSAYEGDIVIPSTVEHDLDTYQVTGLSQNAFMGSEIESLVINDGPTKILKGCINCQKLEKLVLPSTMTSIDGIFAPALEELTLGDNIKSIEASFMIGLDVEALTLPTELKTINGSFVNIENLASLTFGPNVKKIEDSFFNLSSLKNVSLPGSLKTLKNSFSNCLKLESIEIQEGLQKISGCFLGIGTKELKLPKSLAVIEGSFTGYPYNGLTSLVLPEGVTTVSDSFHNFSNVSSLTLPNSLTTTTDSFRGLSSLKEVHFGTGMNDINAVVHRIADLDKIYCPWATPPAAPKNLKYCKALTVYVPKGTAQAYTEAWGLAEVNAREVKITIEEADF